MAFGTLVGAQVQDTTTTTGTGVLTLANAVPAGAPAGSTTFAQQFPSPFQTYPGNTFYAIFDGSGNIEVGLGTLLSATSFSRDYVLGSYTGGLISLQTQTGGASFVNFAAGTKNIYSNVALFATSVAYWARIPDDNAANIFQNVMSGTFVGTITDGGTGTVAVTVTYKITNEGCVVFQIPTATTTGGTGTAMSLTGIPAFLCNSSKAPGATCVILGSASGAIYVPGYAVLTAGATPTSTGSLVFQQYSVVANGFTPVFTTAVNKGVLDSAIVYPLI